ncbi:CRIB domain-containing protein RIC4-like [Typha latifolia]|uniref:CRIB domain-containing protein RIC4-like n=1 Tax=Typha latifolia TaxID=4733 RepID=UPI003C2EA2F6
MRGRKMDKFVVLPFSAGCASQSSIDVVGDQPKKLQEEPTPLPPPSGEKPRGSVGLFAKLIKSLKSLSQLLVVYGEYEEEVEMEMEIGFPTDVQHVGHIGWDGFNNVTSMKSWDGAPHEFLSLPSIKIQQFEMPPLP